VTPELQTTLDNLPDRPGVYLMKDARGEVIYVGKAQSLRSRVRSYWQKGTTMGAVHLIREVIDKVAELDYTLTDSDSEAFLLEVNLIKRHRPRFNIRLKDDKSYPYIKITSGDDFPRVERTRRLPNDGSRYFGPYASATSVDESMNLVRRLFPFRTCTIDIKEGVRALQRPCLLYHIKRCQGPCIQAIDKDAYRADITQIELFLEGRQETLVKALRSEMTAASDGQAYERAAALRDKVKAIERTMQSQKMAGFARTELDVLGLARQDNQAAVQLFTVRDGKLLGRDVFLLEAMREATDDEVLTSFAEQYYARASSIPREILVPRALSETSALEAFLAERRSGPVHLRVPRRGEKRELMELATRNATETLAREHARWLADQGRTLGALEELAAALDLPGPPMRIECYDISTFQGAQSVGSMVVFEEGRPRTGEYRRFRVKTVQGPNDFASHQEVLTRRFRRAKAGDEGSAEELRWKLPDLVIIDGGKGQVAAAKAVFDELGLHDLPLVGLAKEREELFLPGISEPILLPPTSGALYLVQRLRDEAHRFAITYHRDLRAKASIRSAFDDLPGVGPKRKRALLRVFGSAKRVREAPVEQIAAVPGIGPRLAATIKETLEA
jgi:excinuclease ABC subunit C